MAGCAFACFFEYVKSLRPQTYFCQGRELAYNERGCSSAAASFQCQSNLGMDREISIACKQVTVVVRADFGMIWCLRAFACLCYSVVNLGLKSFIISKW